MLAKEKYGTLSAIKGLRDLKSTSSTVRDKLSEAAAMAGEWHYKKLYVKKEEMGHRPRATVHVGPLRFLKVTQNAK